MDFGNWFKDKATAIGNGALTFLDAMNPIDTLLGTQGILHTSADKFVSPPSGAGPGGGANAGFISGGSFSSSTPEVSDSSADKLPEIPVDPASPESITSSADDVTDYNNKIAEKHAADANALSREFFERVMEYNANQAELAFNREQSSADKAMAFNSFEAEKQRQYDMMMSSTAFQRQMADLKAAGLNPKLVMKLTGASYSGGSHATGATASGHSASVSSPSANMSSTDMNSYSSLIGVAANLKQRQSELEWQKTKIALDSLIKVLDAVSPS